MSGPQALQQLLNHSAERRPDHPAVEDLERESISYRELAALSDRLRDRLRRIGVEPGDRVGVYLRKSIDAVAAIWGILKTGAAYVPVDPGAPLWRSAYLLHDCSVKAAVVERRFEEGLRRETERMGKAPPLLLLEGAGGGLHLKATLDREDEQGPAPPTKTHVSSPDDLAYILYTSGSTGKPKGVTLSHRHAVGYIDWCSEEFEPRETDRFSSHAPFHFDLSILDLFVPIKHGATLVLFGEEVGKEPGRLAPAIAAKRISVWYSTPSILSLLVQYGRLDKQDCSSLRLVLFAGEVFPVKHLRALKSCLPRPRYYNLYGPTETNVCTFYEIPREIPENRSDPYPIGKACCRAKIRVVDNGEREVAAGREGELCVSGPPLMQGYWNLPEESARVFFFDSSGERWYRTGDLVTEDSDGNYVYVGRQDRMVKRRGYRVELGEIEAALYRHRAVAAAAAIALSDEESGVRIKVFVSCRAEERPTIIELKQFCSENLPQYMIPDLFSFQEVLPKTSTDKIDYQKLKEIE